MADLFYTLFIIWNLLWLFGLICIFLRADNKIILVELFSMLVQPNIFLILISILLIYTFIPLTIPYSIRTLLNEKKEDKEDE